MPKVIANAFKDGDAVIVKATASRPDGSLMPQAGKRGVIVQTPKKGRHMVDVAGMPMVNLLAEDLEPAAAAPGAPAAQTPIHAATSAPAEVMHANKQQPPGTTTYAFDVLLLTAIVPSLTNPRTHFDPEALQSLADNIKADSLLQPILVRPLPAARLGDTFTDRRKGDPLPTHEIVAGERRYRACGMAGVRSVPVMVRNLTDEQVLRMQLVENVQREGLHPLEEAHGYRRILDLPSQATRPMTERVAELAGTIKKSTRYIYQTLQLLHLCDFAQKVFLEGKLERTTALQVATIGNEAGQIEATRRIAGLQRTGTSTTVVDNPMSLRAAADYVRSNHRLVLSKAPFSIKIALAGVEACGTCPKMSANATDLFDEGAKGPDTCMDPSCYGRKNAAHVETMALAARAKGQKVVTGAAAKKIKPSKWSDELEGYIAVDEKQFGAGLSGQTLKQLLGKDMPLPTLIQDPHEDGFIEAIPEADVKRLFKERGIGSAKDVGVSSHKATQRDNDQKDKVERAYRQAWCDAIMARADNVDDVDLFDGLLVPLLTRLYQRLDNDNTKRVHKIMGWAQSPFGYSEHVKTEKFFQDMAPGEVNKFIIAACISGELHIAQYCKPGSQQLDSMSKLLQVDAKAIKAKLAADARAIDKAKADKVKAKAFPVKQSILARRADKAKATTATSGGMATKFAIGERVRFKEGLKGPAGHFRKCCGKTGVVSGFNGGQYTVRLDGVTDPAMASFDELLTEPEPKASNKTQWRDITAVELKALQPGVRVRIKTENSLQKIKKAYASNVGLLGGRLGDSGCTVVIGDGKQAMTISFDVTEIQVEATNDSPVAPATKNAANKKADPATKQTSLELPPAKGLHPQSAWPFPTAV